MSGSSPGMSLARSLSLDRAAVGEKQGGRHMQWATIPRIGRTALVAAAWLGMGAAAIAAEEIRVSGSGGQSGESVKEGYIKPFMEKSGSKVVFENIAGSPLGVLQAMVESRNITSVLVEMG